MIKWTMYARDGVDRIALCRDKREEDIPARFMKGAHLLLASDYKMDGGAREYEVPGVGRLRVFKAGQAFLFFERGWYEQIIKE